VTTPIDDVGARTWIERNLLRVLQPLMGSAAEGMVTIKTLNGGADTVLPGGAFGIPFMTSATGKEELDFTRLVRVVGPVDDTGGYEYSSPDITVTAAGVAAHVVSVTGGINANLPAGTRILWDPMWPGIEPISTLSAAMDGGVQPAFEFGTVKQIVGFDEIGITKATASSEAWRARLTVFPAVIVALLRTTRGERTAPGRRRRMHQFRVYVFGSHFGGAELRRNEAKAVLDNIERLLEDRCSVDEQAFADEISVDGAGLATAEDGSYVHFVDVSVPHTVVRWDVRRFNDWTLTQAALLTSATQQYPDLADALRIVDATFSQ
jgi:hypothetical protein